MSWKTRGKLRTIIYNLTVPAVKNNIDLCVLAASPEEIDRSLYSDASRYLAFGELKGGIDPAGADEHWKTARSALHRIHIAFAGHKPMPALFFIGAAIESKMSDEIWAMLKSRELANAANLTDDVQSAALAAWVIAL